MYISNLVEEKKNEIVKELERYHIDFEVWYTETEDTTLFIPNTKKITLSLGGAFDMITFMDNGKCLKFIALDRKEYYQIVW